MDFWNIREIFNKNKFLTYLIEHSPEGSIWQADGIEDKKICLFLAPYLTENAKKVYLKLGDLEKDFFEITLTKSNKILVAKEVMSWNLENNINSQSIAYDNEIYFKSYDYLDQSCAWVSTKFNLAILEKQGFIELEN